MCSAVNPVLHMNEEERDGGEAITVMSFQRGYLPLLLLRAGRLLHQLHKGLKKQVPEAQTLTAEHNAVTGLSAVGTATGHERNSRGSILLWL